MFNQGLTSREAEERQKKYGKNQLFSEKKQSILKKIISVITEPMFLLLIIAATIYFILGEPRDGFIMLIFVVGVISIETVQEWKTDKTLKALKDLSSPKVKVIRDGKETEIDSINLVPEDIMLIYEGVKIPADGYVVETRGLCIDESSLTGESEGKWKTEYDPASNEGDYFKSYYCYAGTVAVQGFAKVKVDKIGTATEYGKIGNKILEAKPNKTLLEKQTGSLVRICALIAIVLFLLVATITFFILPEMGLKEKIIESILSGITLAMAMIPEEFPVILTVFLSMGAWRLAKKNSLVRKLPAVETLGAVSVLCVDKTGTITQNRMTVDEVYEDEGFSEQELALSSACACEQNAFDSMEIAILNFAEKNSIDTNQLFTNPIVKSFPFTNETKMMGNIYRFNEQYTLYVKGAYESVLKLCRGLDEQKIHDIEERISQISKKGLRVLAVAKQEMNEPIGSLDFAQMLFVGLISFVDPPRTGIEKDIQKCYQAGIRVIMITGDNGLTASSIANRVGIKNCNELITGRELDAMSDDMLKRRLKTTNIFSRVIPEHKMRIVKILQEMGEVVAMTGDGVNDAPALKHADIGIAMGKRGSEVSREAADLILLDDNFHTIVNTIEDGRRIYDNIKKAVGYVFAIHIPIALSSLIAPMLGILPQYLFLLPLHVVLMELLIDPTCSIVLERQPAEENVMNRGPRKINEKLINKSFLFRSVLQGLALFAASFGGYYYFYKTNDIFTARSFGMTVLFLGNIFLVNVSTSFYYSFITITKKLLKDKVMWIINFATIILLLLIVYTPVNKFLKMDPLSFKELLLAIALAFISVFWYEAVKGIRRKKIKKHISQ